jgi:hypothetical protein
MLLILPFVPKIKNPTRESEFRPINLCNVLYKIIFNVLANRLKDVLPHITSYNQSAFIPGRMITDNILVAYETLHSMHTGIWGKVGFMGLNLDLSKACDKIEWIFLEAVMRRLWFSTRWIRFIMVCI